MPAAAAPIAPAKPTTPAPTPPPAPTPSPAPQPSPQHSDPDPFTAELDAKFKAAGEPGDTTKPKPSEKPDPKPAEKSEPPAPDPELFKGANPRLRKEYERVKGELESERKTAGEKLTSLEAKLKEYEAKGMDTAALTARIEAIEKEKESITGELRALKQEASPEFKEKYEKPFEQAADFAKNDITQMAILNEAGEPERNATWDDFVALYRLPPNKAIAEARRLFGDAAEIVTDHLRTLRRLDFQKSQAFETEKANFKARIVEDQGKAAAHKERIEQARKKVDEDLVASVDDYRDSPDDKESSKVRQSAYEMFDRPPKTLQEAIIKERHVRHVFAANMAKRLQIARLKKELDETKAQLDSFKNPQPGSGKRPGGEAETTPTESWEEGIRKAVSAA